MKSKESKGIKTTEFCRCVLRRYDDLLYGKANPSVLIGSFLVGISPYGPFPWKRSSAAYFFVFESRKIQNKHSRVPYNKLLTNQLARAVLKNIGPRSFLYGPRANIPQYGPRARLVRG